MSPDLPTPLGVGQMLTGIGGSDNYRNGWVKSFPEYLGQMIPGRVGQILPVHSPILIAVSKWVFGSIFHYSFVPSMNLEFQALLEGDDDDFNAIYPSHIRRLAKKHWTPIDVAKNAALFLAHRRGLKVLDIGSGVGKFCMIGSAVTRGHFTGVEQRSELVDLAQTLSAYYDLANTTYFNANIISVDFREFNGFYLYNSFFENLDKRNGIDKTIALSEKLYSTYGAHVADKLSSLPSGVRLATYYTDEWVVPTNFELVYNLFNGNLKLWEKVN